MTRFTILVAAIVVVTVSGVASIVTITLSSPAHSASTVTMIIGFCATITASMLAILRVELNAHEIRVTRDAVDRKIEQTNTSVREIERKINGNLESAIHTAVSLERQQTLVSTAMPKTTEELEALLGRAVRLALEGQAHGAASTGAEMAEGDREGEQTKGITSARVG